MIVLYWRRFLEPAVVSRVLVAFLPTGLIGFALYRVVKTYLFDSEAVVLWALGLGGVALIVFELLHREGDDAVPDVASISLLKGASDRRVSEPIHCAGRIQGWCHHRRRLILGLSRSTIVEFSFLLAVPTMLAATGYDLLKNASIFGPNSLVSSRQVSFRPFFVALLSIKFLLAFVRTNTFIPLASTALWPPSLSRFCEFGLDWFAVR